MNPTAASALPTRARRRRTPLWIAGSVLAVAGVVGVSVVAGAGRSDSLRCSWSDDVVSRHVAALTRARADAFDTLTEKSSVLGNSLVKRRSETDSTRDSLTRVLEPTTCADLGVTADMVAADGRFESEAYEVRLGATAFSSWHALDAYVTRGSMVSAQEVNTSPDRIYEGYPSPYTHRVENVDGHAGWDLYCFPRPGGRCNVWNLLARSGTCRSLLIDAEVTFQVSGTVADQQDASDVLVPAAAAGLNRAETELAAEKVGCSSYGGSPSGQHWSPPT
jgi:hypothetical protein